MGLFSDKGKYRNKVGLDEKWINFLKAEFRELEKYKRGITNAILKYLLDDENAGVLTQVKNIALKNKTSLLPGSGILLYVHNRNNREKKGDFYSRAYLSDPGFYYRLAQIFVSYHSSFGQFSLGKHFTTSLKWVIVFLASLSYRFIGGISAEKYGFFDFLMMEQILEYAGERPGLLMDEVFFPSGSFYYTRLFYLICGLNGFRDRVSAYPDIVNKALDDKSVNIREHALVIINKYKVNISPAFINIIWKLKRLYKDLRETTGTDRSPRFS